jgi:hypothetical protein
MRTDLERLVRRRANARCEYCQIPQSSSRITFPIDHVIALQHGGATREANLALACRHCNLHKGPNVGGIDPEDGAFTPLFHPRRDRWADHFTWRGAELVGRTPIGRVTIHVLAINARIAVEVREALIAEGSFPRR